MKKTYRMILAMVLMVLGAMNVSGQELVSLQDVPFWAHSGAWGTGEAKAATAECPFVIGEPTGQPYGDGNVNNFADLSDYEKLIVTVSAGKPRMLFNRDADGGQPSATESESHLIDNTNGECLTWAAKYFTEEDNVYTVDLKQMYKDKGFVHLHAIKGANWADVTVESMMLVKPAKPVQKVGWTSLIANGTMEGDDAASILPATAYSVDMSFKGFETGTESSFYSKVNGGEPYASEIEDGVGVDGSRGIKVHSAAGATNDWDAQFWINGSEDLPEGAKVRVSFDYCATRDVKVSTQTHGTPSCYIIYHCAGDVEFTTEWKHYENEFTVESDMAAAASDDKSLFHSIAFNLSVDKENDVDFFFDNVKFEVYKYGTTAAYDQEAVQLDFGFDTNVAELIKAQGAKRLIFPEGTAKVTVNGEEAAIMSVEGFEDGRFYIFMEETIDDNAEVKVVFNNPTDEAYRLKYTSGAAAGTDVGSFDGIADYSEYIYQDASGKDIEGVYAYIMVTPTLMTSDPEEGSFNLPNSIKEFKMIFDKNVDCSKLQATLGSEKLTVTTEGLAKEVVLTRTGSGDLANGAYVIKLDKIYPEEMLDVSVFGTAEVKINVGKVDYDPNDMPKEMIPDYFASTAAGAIPEGYFVKFGEEDRPSQSTWGSGPRMFDFAAGGDFTKGLYYREGYVEYGSTEGYELTLTAGKRYDVKFNSVMWRDNGPKMRFQILNKDGEILLTQMIDNKPNVNGGTGAVSGSTKTTVRFVPEADGNYILRWTSATSADGNPGNVEVVLANVQMTYMPNVPGLEETQLLEAAMTKAKSAREANDDERHHGPAFDALDAAIKKYEAEAPTYTGPSMYTDAAADLEAKTKTLQDHATLCNKYDDLVKQLPAIVADNANKKFAQMDLYQELKSFRDEYCTMGTEVKTDDSGNTYTEEVLADWKKLTDDAELQAAIDAIDKKLQAAKYMFTEGESKNPGDVGVKVLVDRIRQGVEGLKQLGVADTDELIVKANNAVSDDDNLAEEIKNRLKLEFYNKQKNGEDMFPVTTDDDLNDVTPKYNFTVFVKNPNTYAWDDQGGVNEENCPGWTVDGGVGLTNAWNGSYPGNIEGLPKDLFLTQWHGVARIEQTITDLPAGVYSIMCDVSEWSDDYAVAEDDTEEAAASKNDLHAQNRLYVKTSDTPVAGEGEEEQFAASELINHWGTYVASHDNYLEPVVVTDGQLTLGAKWGVAGSNKGQFMFSHVKVFLTAPAEGFDYAKGYQEVVDAVETPAAAAKVRAIELYDLNGQRIPAAKKGIVIVKKIMSDGTIKTEKVIK
ncbi:MAG: hypothetical protein IJ551_07870 [Prevotella sp.]|nr:hypothetical protein [Prevotella sp.]